MAKFLVQNFQIWGSKIPKQVSNFPQMQQEPCWLPEAGEYQMTVPLKGEF